MKKLLACVLVVGCSGGKPFPDDSFDDLAGVDQKSDAFSAYMKVVGPTLLPGQSSSVISYSKGPRYRAVQLNVKGGGTLAITVRSTDGGDALTWLLDAKFHTLGKNDDASDSTLDSHIVYNKTDGGGASYWIVFRDYDWARHHFVVDVAPVKPAASCDVGLDIPDEPPAQLSELESLYNNSPGSFQLYDFVEPDCLDYSSASVRAAIADDVRANSNINWRDATPVVVQGSPLKGATNFLAALTTARDEIGGFANSTTPKTDLFKMEYPHIDADQTAVIGDSTTNPGAYFEFHLHIEAEECSQEGWGRVDTRSGEIVMIRVHGC